MITQIGKITPFWFSDKFHKFFEVLRNFLRFSDDTLAPGEVK
jgi:hypothetical protein